MEHYRLHFQQSSVSSQAISTDMFVSAAKQQTERYFLFSGHLPCTEHSHALTQLSFPALRHRAAASYKAGNKGTRPLVRLGHAISLGLLPY